MSSNPAKARCTRYNCMWESLSVTCGRSVVFSGFVTNYINTTDATSGAGTAHPSGAPEFTSGFEWGFCYSIFSFICMFCRSLFVLLYFFFWPLCCLFFFNIRILITPLVSLNSFSSIICNMSRYRRPCLGPLNFLLQKIFTLFNFLVFWLWSFLMKRIPETKLDIYVFIASDTRLSIFYLSNNFYMQEEFEDIKGVIRIRKSKDRQHNDQKKKGKQWSTKHTHKTKDRVTRTPLKIRGWTQVLRKVRHFLQYLRHVLQT